MRKNLEAALVLLGWPKQYSVEDALKMPVTDGNRQYGTPTVLIDGNDLMGMPRPKPNRAEPG